ncbi:MAG TPA: amino acid adenylation domain-containing protein, partial [Longimicrobiaceae bacterium]|nr:amino acid adenylation domain-containing protein [Longimicrobiaceae bacterium]
AALQEQGRRWGVTMSTLVQGAWALLLARYAGEEEVVFGATVAGRPAELGGVEEMVGLFINTLPVRVRVEEEAELESWLGRLQEEQARAREYEYAPLAEVQKWSEVPAGEPLFESLVAFENYLTDQGLGEGLRGLRVRSDLIVEEDGFPLVLTAAVETQLIVHLRHDRGRVDGETAERLTGQLEVVLEALVRHPERRVGELSLLREAERVQVLERGRGEALLFPREALVHEVIAQRAAGWPDVPAVACGGRTLTYREMGERAGRLAARLRRSGVGPETPVAIFLDRSEKLAISILGVLEAGGAFVPLDPEYPAERLEYMLRDSGARVVLTRTGLAGALPGSAPEVVCVDAEVEPVHSSPPPATGSDTLAYLVYTSGSTGRPKAAMVSHRSLLCYAEAMRGRIGLDAADRVLQFASPAFDVLVEELFPAWLSGACVVFPPRDLLGSPRELQRVLAEERITVVELPTAFWHEWVRTLVEEGRALPESLRLLLLGGERVIGDRLAWWAGLGVPLLHVFGLTETTVTTTTLLLDRGDDGARWSNLPIGAPLANAEVCVLDAQQQPVPVGVPGELYVGGEAVARGYRARPELTAARYLPHPFASAAGARMYRTGDRVRWLGDGVLEFLGRIDQQVKVRGYRIEPAEVEAVLVAHPAVREAVVTVREDTPGSRRLVGYVVPAGESAPPAGELREHLAAALPAYMVPPTFVVLPALPLTRNGKVDRRALPAPDPGRPSEGPAYQAPRTAAEEALARIWAEVLGLERAGVDDNFFELGGDSILSIQVVSRARGAGLRLTPRQIFEYPTVAALARHADGAEPVSAAEEPVAGPAPLTPIQCWFFEQEIPERHHWNMPLLLRVRRRLDAATLERALAGVLERHDVLRLRFERGADGRWAQARAEPGGPVPFQVVDLSALPETEQSAAVEERSAGLQRTLDLGRAPLLRAAYFDLGAGRDPRLLLVAHHLVVDGVSWRVILEELEAALGPIGRRDPGTESTPFLTWAGRLARHTREGGFDAELPYWSAAVRGRVGPLPVDFPRGGSGERTARMVSVSLSAEETRALLQEVPAAYRTQVNDVLLCALASALAPWTGEDRVLVEVEGHGREELFPGVDLTRTVGWFTTLFPVLLELRGLQGPGERLKAVKEQLRAVPGRGIGYGALRYLGSDAARAALAAQPRGEVRFEYLGRLDASVPEGALFRLAPESPGPRTGAGGERSHRLVVSGSVLDGVLQIRLEYGEEVHRRETAEFLAQRYLSELRGLIGHCASEEAGGYTPSDFPLAGLDQETLDELLGSERGIEDVFPLTSMQEGMLFHTLLEPGHGVYVGQVCYEVRGRIDADAFRHAWQGVLDRHAALRAAFPSVPGGGVPVQVVRRRVALPFLQQDWRGCLASGREAALEAYLREDRTRGFDPSVAPLLRVALFRTGEASHYLVWSFHQMVLDGWSLPLVFRDLAALYDASLRGEEPRLPRFAPFREYVGWLRRQDPVRAECYWKELLAGFTGPTPLPLDGTGAGEHPGIEVAELHLSREASDSLQALVRRHGLTVNTLLQGAWALLLSRYGAEEDVVFGTTVSGRPAELDGVDGTVGLFINTLPVRIRVSASAPLLPWLHELQAQNATLREYEYTPLVQVQGWSEVPRGTPLFESITVFENYPADLGPQRTEWELEAKHRAAREQGSFPITVVAELRTELVLGVRYERSRIDAEGAQRMGGHLEAVLETMAADPHRRLSQLSLLRPAERLHLLRAGHGPHAPLS